MKLLDARESAAYNLRMRTVATFVYRRVLFALFAVVVVSSASPCAMAGSVTLLGLAQQNVGFAQVPGVLVVCEGKVVGGLCDSAGVSDLYDFGFGDFVSSTSDRKEFFELIAWDFDASNPLLDQGDRHIEEGDLYSALIPTDPGYDLTNHSAVTYTFAPSALGDVPEPGTAVSLGLGVVVVTIIHYRRQKPS